MQHRNPSRQIQGPVCMRGSRSAKEHGVTQNSSSPYWSNFTANFHLWHACIRPESGSNNNGGNHWFPLMLKVFKKKGMFSSILGRGLLLLIQRDLQFTSCTVRMQSRSTKAHPSVFRDWLVFGNDSHTLEWAFQVLCWWCWCSAFSGGEDDHLHCPPSALQHCPLI